MSDASKGIGIGIDTMGHQEEPCTRERPLTTQEKIEAFDLSKCLQGAYEVSAFSLGCCDDIARDDAMPSQINYSLHLCWDACEEDYERIVLEAMERIVKAAKRWGRLK